MDTANAQSILQRIIGHFYPNVQNEFEDKIPQYMDEKEIAMQPDFNSVKEPLNPHSKDYFDPLSGDTKNLINSTFENTSRIYLNSIERTDSIEERTIVSKSMAETCQSEESHANLVNHDYEISVDYNSRETSFPVETDKSSSQSISDFVGVQMNDSSESERYLQKPKQSILRNVNQKSKKKSHRKFAFNVSTQSENLMKNTGSQTTNLPAHSPCLSSLFPNIVQYNTVSFEGDHPIYLIMSDQADESILKIQLSDVVKSSANDQKLTAKDKILSSSKEFNKIIKLGRYQFNVVNERTSPRHFTLTIYDITPNLTTKDNIPIHNSPNDLFSNSDRLPNQDLDKSRRNKIHNRYKSLLYTFKSTKDHEISKDLLNEDSTSGDDRKENSLKSHILRSQSNNEYISYHPIFEEIRAELNEQNSSDVLKKISENYKKIFLTPMPAVYSTISNFNLNAFDNKYRRDSVFESDDKFREGSIRFPSNKYRDKTLA